MKTLMVLAWVTMCAAPRFAQGAVAGAVSDPSGARLSGVLVEASSDSLIERSRTAVTDGAGSYRIEDLRPGTYRIRFTLGGWRTCERAAVSLTGPVTVTVNAQLDLGPLTELVTVSSGLRVVDVRSAVNVLTRSGDLARSLPTVRSYHAINNALNSNAVLAYNNAFVPGGTWLRPMTILTPRFAKVTAEIEF
jgi:hypothetical protein